MARQLTAEELLAGASTTYPVELPASLLPNVLSNDGHGPGEVVIRPLTIRDIQRIAQAAKEERVITSVLMIQQALVTPKLTVEQAGSLPAGVVQFLLGKINKLSGLSIEEEELDTAVKAPLSRACFVLAREFGWSPSECAQLTVGQILVYLEMLARKGEVVAP